MHGRPDNKFKGSCSDALPLLGCRCACSLLHASPGVTNAIIRAISSLLPTRIEGKCFALRGDLPLIKSVLGRREREGLLGKGTKRGAQEFANYGVGVKK